MPEALDLPEPNEEPISVEGGEEPSPIPPIAEPVEVEPISLVEGGEVQGEVKAFGSSAIKTESKSEFKRPLNVNRTGATRFKMFHSKIAVASLEHMEHSINEWLDSEEVEVKHTTTVIGTMTGKTPEPNIILSVWY